jgi:hypothetical protein
MNQSKKWHQIAVKLLDKLGVEYLRLEQTAGGFRYAAWSTPIVANNGGSKVRRGTVRLKSAG